MTSPSDTKAIEAELLRLEDERTRATIDGNNAVLERLMSDDIVYTHSNGRVDTKASFIAAIVRGTTKYRRVQRRDVAVSVRDGFAFLTGGVEIDVEAGGQLRHLNLRFSNVWERAAQGWRQILWQTTPIPPQ